MHFQDISIGRSSWRTSSGSRTISIATRQTAMGCRGEAVHCCKVSLFADRCGRRMGLHYSGPHGSYPVYVCRADQHQHGGPRCQEVRALGVDAAVERLLLEALTPDRLALAIVALGELENEARALEHQWSLKRERARYEAERARRQYDAVERSE